MQNVLKQQFPNSLGVEGGGQRQQCDSWDCIAPSTDQEVLTVEITVLASGWFRVPRGALCSTPQPSISVEKKGSQKWLLIFFLTLTGLGSLDEGASYASKVIFKERNSQLAPAAARYWTLHCCLPPSL